MRLLNTQSLQFKEFTNHGDRQLEYAILSHRWVNDEEVSYQEFLLITASDDILGASASLHRRSVLEQKARGSGYRKILKACERAREDGLSWIWIDTCCIDKTSSAELSEAINSMWKWYSLSTVCYAYLMDVERNDEPATTKLSFERSEWFIRGWTLQELLASEDVRFFDKNWNFIFNKDTGKYLISKVTGIDSDVVQEPFRVKDISINTKMAWAANRKTTRIEDQAYCLLGLFNINMPLLYGEGTKAFLRLQKEIIAQSDDESILAHKHIASNRAPLAKGPGDFDLGGKIVRQLRGATDVVGRFRYHFENTQIGNHPFTVTNKGIQWRAAFVRGAADGKASVIALHCRYETTPIPFLLEIQKFFGQSRRESVGDLYSVSSAGVRSLCIQEAAAILEKHLLDMQTSDPFEYKTVVDGLRTAPKIVEM